MLDRKEVRRIFRSWFEYDDYEIPKGLEQVDLVEVFCSYVEDDCEDWILDRYKQFFLSDEARLRQHVQEYLDSKKPATPTLNLDHEWDVVIRETHKKPDIDGPYPPEIVKRREIILLAQSLLADYQTTPDPLRQTALAYAYQTFMKFYFAPELPANISELVEMWYNDK